ncbi:MAG: TonB-dependent receptor [Gemmatimonadota bacterium]|nr:TonB-dependent receptor [Gemmatimonadota bacterium]
MTLSYTNRIIVAVATVGVASLVPHAAAAQQVDSIAQRDSIARRDSVLRAGAVTRDSIYRLAPVEVQASIAPIAGPTIGSGIPARITMLGGAAVDQWEPRILPDVLGTIAGVSIYDDLGSQYKINVEYRGFNTGPTVGLPPGITVFLDGVRQNEADAQEVDFDLLPMDHVRRVELLSGTASLLGPNSLGGAINLVTDRGEGPMHGSLELTGGSFGQVEVEGTVEGKSTSGWDYYLGGGYEREDGWRVGTFGKNYNGFLNVGHFGAVRGVGLQAVAAKSRVGAAGSIPESLYGDPQVNFTPGDVEDLNMQQLNLTGYLPFGGGRGTLTLYGKRFDADRFNVNQAPDPNVDALTKTYTIGSTADWRRQFIMGARSLSLRFGVDGSKNWVREQLINSPSEVDNGDGGIGFGNGGNAPELGLTTDVKSPSWDIAGYGLTDYNFSRVTLSAGLRYDYIRVPFQNQLDGGDNTTNTFHHFSPRGGVSVNVGGGASLYGSVGGSFRAPAIVELACADPTASCPLPFALGADPPLKPVRATTYELGGKWLHNNLLFDASVYRTDVRDEVFFIQSSGSLVSGYFTNLDKTRREGVEFSVTSSLWEDRISWYANYAYTKATFQSDAQIFSTRADSNYVGNPLFGPNNVTPGDRMPLVPANQVKGGFSAWLPKGFRVGLDARWIGSQYLRGDEGNEQDQLDPYFLMGVRAGFTYRNWGFSGVMTNVLNNHSPMYGTYNANAGTGQLERFLTPLNARILVFKISRTFGPRGQDSDDN